MTADLVFPISLRFMDEVRRGITVGYRDRRQLFGLVHDSLRQGEVNSTNWRDEDFCLLGMGKRRVNFAVCLSTANFWQCDENIDRHNLKMKRYALRKGKVGGLVSFLLLCNLYPYNFTTGAAFSFLIFSLYRRHLRTQLNS